MFPPSGGVCRLLVAALDSGRHWSPVPWWVCAIGYALFLLGLDIVTWAGALNKFFETTVRIQTDRGHKVIDAGPYAVVRHPGYVGFMLFFVGSALCLGSLWALIPAGLASGLLVLRTRSSERWGAGPGWGRASKPSGVWAWRFQR